MAQHNKKRNSGIMYELLLRQASADLVDNKADDSKRVMGIIRRNFRKGTQLQREQKLYDSLIKTTVSSMELARKIVTEMRAVACSLDHKALDAEKTQLFVDVAKNVRDRKGLLERKIPEYKVLATLGTLMADWKNPSGSNIARIAEYEDKLAQWLTLDKTRQTLEEHVDVQIDPLVVKVMVDKFNKKFSDLSEEQRRSLAVLATGDRTEAATSLRSLKEATLKRVDQLRSDAEIAGDTADKLEQVRTMLAESKITEEPTADELQLILSAAALIEDLG